MQEISQKTLKDTMYYRDITVFIYTIHYPVFTSTCSVLYAHAINEYYASISKEREIYCRTVLYPQAVESAQYIQNNYPPFHNYEFYIDYKITYNSSCITSLYFEEYSYMGGAHGSTIRTSDTWDFSTGKQLKLSDFYSPNSIFIKKIQKSIEHQISKVLKTYPSTFFSDYTKLLQDNFNPKNYYLTPNGIIIYYQQYEIAPYSSGIPEFLIPFLAGSYLKLYI